MSVEKPKKFCSLQMFVEVQDGCSRMDWLSLNVLIVGSADVVLRRWSVLFDSVLGRYMDINVFKITSPPSFSLFHFFKSAKPGEKTFPSL